MLVQKLLIIIWIQLFLKSSLASNITCEIFEGTSIFQDLLDNLTKIVEMYDVVLLNYYKNLTGSCDLSNDFEYTEDDMKHYFPDYEFLMDMNDYINITAKLELGDMETNFGKLSERREDALLDLKEEGRWNPFD